MTCSHLGNSFTAVYTSMLQCWFHFQDGNGHRRVAGGDFVEQGKLNTIYSTANKIFAFLAGNGWAGLSAEHPLPARAGHLWYNHLLSRWWHLLASGKTITCIRVVKFAVPGVPLSPHPSSSGQTINWVEEHSDQRLSLREYLIKYQI